MVRTRSSRLTPSPPSTPNIATSSTKKTSRSTREAKSSPQSLTRQYQGKQRKNGLPLDIKKQLIEDIEAQGGIKTVIGDNKQDLARLLDKRPELYGERGESTREVARQFFHQVARLHRKGEYQTRVLGPFRVPSFAERQKELLSSPNESPSSHSRSDSESSHLSNQQDNISSKEEDSPIVADLSKQFKEASTIYSPTLNNMVMRNVQEFVDVDLDNPYANGSVVVFPLMGIKGCDGVDDLQGFAIIHRFDKRHLLRNMELSIAARIQTDNRIVISGLPTEDYGLLHVGVTSLQTASQAGGNGGLEFLIDGLINANNTFNDPETRLFERRKEIVLQFLKDVKLNVTKIKNAAVNSAIHEEDFMALLPAKMIAVGNDYDQDVAKEHEDQLLGLEGLSHYLVWVVARTDIRAFKRNKLASTDTRKKSDFAKSFGL